jgi:hypothetical protein
MHLDRPYPYVTTDKRSCDCCSGSLKLVKYPDHDHGKVYCSSTCYANGVAQDVQFLEDSQVEFDFIEDIEDDICQCKRCKPPPE